MSSSWARPTNDAVRQHFPWRICTEHDQAAIVRRLRDHGEYVVSGGSALSEYRLKRLRAFHRQLREADVVVEYNPDIPPQPGVSRAGGFALRARRPADGDLMIRVNEYTRLTREGRTIWRLPDHEPSLRSPAR